MFICWQFCNGISENIWNASFYICNFSFVLTSRSCYSTQYFLVVNLSSSVHIEIILVFCVNCMLFENAVWDQPCFLFVKLYLKTWDFLNRAPCNSHFGSSRSNVNLVEDLSSLQIWCTVTVVSMHPRYVADQYQMLIY